MRNRSILVMIMVILWAGTAADAKYSDGTGEPNDPYRIATAEDLNDIGNHLEDFNKHFILVNDVNLADYTGMQFSIIGNSTTKFTGVFDGNDNKVWNFTWTSNGIHRIGLFGCVGTGGQIKNLGMENVDVNAVNGNYVGGLVGFNQGTITNCYCTGSVGGDQDVGGLVGCNWNGTINNSQSSAMVSGTYDIGGLAGYNGGTITNCYSAGSVTGNDDIGGLIGYNPGTIIDSNSNAVISGKNYVGGLTGENDYGTITNCYSTGNVSGTGSNVGGLVGYNDHGSLGNCSSAGSVSGLQYVGGLVGWNREDGEITDCYSVGGVLGKGPVGGLVGGNDGTIMDSSSTGAVEGYGRIGGLVGENNYGSTITSCYSTGSVAATGDYVGGLVGYSPYGIITSCYATGTVMGRDRVGGLVGEKYAGTTQNCYSRGSVSGRNYVGGLVGWGEGVTKCYSTGNVSGTGSSVGGLTGLGGATNSFWDVETSGQSKSGGGTGKLTDEMKTKSTFTGAGWDFVNIWDICDGTNYPRLRWQILLGDFICPDGVDFVDFAVLASAWQSDPSQPNWLPACDISEPKDSFIDLLDLAVFCENWLEGK